MLGISINLLLVLLVVVSLLLLAVVLMQRPKNEGLGAAFGAALTDQAFGARTTDVLKKASVYFGAAFLIICLVLSMLMNREHTHNSESLLKNDAAVEQPAEPVKTPEQIQQEELLKRAAEASAEAPAPAAPVSPAEPVAPEAPAPAEPAAQQ